MEGITLVLEDNKERMKTFKLYCHNLKHVETSKDCIDIIKSGKNIKELWLDHDLGNETYVNSQREDCGMEVVRFLLKENRIGQIEKIYVHSHNVYANRIMAEDLSNAGYNSTLFPFSSLYKKVREQE